MKLIYYKGYGIEITPRQNPDHDGFTAVYTIVTYHPEWVKYSRRYADKICRSLQEATLYCLRDARHLIDGWTAGNVA